MSLDYAPRRGKLRPMHLDVFIFGCLFSSYAQQSLIPQEPFEQTVSIKCQRATTEGRLVHRGQCLVHLKSRMRSHSGRKSWATLHETKGFLDVSERHGQKGSTSSQLPHISTSHQSQVTRPISSGMWQPGELNGIADTFHRVCSLLRHIASLSTPENLPAWGEKDLLG